MATIAEVEKLAFDLSEDDRATLAARLLESLPPGPYDEDDGEVEVDRRDAEMDADPTIGLSLEQFNQMIKNRRK